MTGLDAEAIGVEVLSALDSQREISPFSTRDRDFDLDAAYAAAAELRRLRTLRGERQVGRKIGFTNRNIWAEYNVDAPIWGDMYDSTVKALSGTGKVSLAQFVQPRIEPEIVFKLAKDVRPGADEAGLLSAIEWAAHGFEIVQSIFPQWRFQGTDTIAAGGLHAALLVGPPHPVNSLGADPVRALTEFTVTLSRDGNVVDHGKGANVLGNPLSALRHLVDLLARDRFNPPFRAGEFITTGTLTRAFPVAVGERWTTSLEGVAFEGLAIEFV